MDQRQEKNIALIGFMGVGKSTVSHMLKQMAGLEEIDTDAQIVAEANLPITEIFRLYGEPHFRALETQAVRNLEGTSGKVISCGGGLVMRPENVESLKRSSRIVLLTASPSTILERVKDSTDRPILNGHMEEAYIAELMEKRRAAYEAAADFIVPTDGRTARAVCQEILTQVKGGVQ